MRRFRALAGGLLAAALVALLPMAAQAQTTTVPCSGPGGGPAGLVAAINQANAASGADRVNLAAGCTYTLTVPDNHSSVFGENGLPLVTGPLSIQGNGATIARDPGAPAFRIFEIDPVGALTIKELTVTGGDAPVGGGILNQGKLTMTHSRVSNNTATVGLIGASGGGILNGGEGAGVTLTDVEVSNNTGNGIDSFGGVITLTDVEVRNHTRFGVVGFGAKLQMRHSKVTGNGSGVEGSAAGVYVSSDSSATLTDVEVSNNTGNGIVGDGATLKLVHSRVTGNNNDGSFGGGIRMLGNLTVKSSRVENNRADSGGGIFVDSGTWTVSNSIIAGNTATGVGETDNSGFGGGIFNNGSGTIVHSRITDNTARFGGGGIFNLGSVRLKASPVVGNTPDNCRPAVSVTGCVG